MPWGQQEQQAREAATALLRLVREIEKDLARLQEQQKSDESRYQELRQDLSHLRVQLQRLEVRYKEFDGLLSRIQLLETVATEIGANLNDLIESFESYKTELEDRANELKVEAAIAEAERHKKLRRQIGTIGAAFFVGLAPAMPMIYTWLAELIKRLLD